MPASLTRSLGQRAAACEGLVGDRHPADAAGRHRRAVPARRHERRYSERLDGRANRTQTQLAAVLRAGRRCRRGVSRSSLLTRRSGRRAAPRPRDAALPPAIARLRALVSDSPEQLRVGARRRGDTRVTRWRRRRRGAAGRRAAGAEPLVADGRAGRPSCGASWRRCRSAESFASIARRRDSPCAACWWAGRRRRGVRVLFGVLGMTVFVSGSGAGSIACAPTPGHLAHGEPLGPPASTPRRARRADAQHPRAPRVLRAREAQVRWRACPRVDGAVNRRRSISLRNGAGSVLLALHRLRRGIFGASGCFKRAHSAWARLPGWTPEELTAKPYRHSCT